MAENAQNMFLRKYAYQLSQDILDKPPKPPSRKSLTKLARSSSGVTTASTPPLPPKNEAAVARFLNIIQVADQCSLELGVILQGDTATTTTTVTAATATNIDSKNNI